MGLCDEEWFAREKRILCLCGWVASISQDYRRGFSYKRWKVLSGITCVLLLSPRHLFCNFKRYFRDYIGNLDSQDDSPPSGSAAGASGQRDMSKIATIARSRVTWLKTLASGRMQTLVDSQTQLILLLPRGHLLNRRLSNPRASAALLLWS